MNNDFQISYSPVGSVLQEYLTYVIVGAREEDKWIFVRNKYRGGWELPAGHIEIDESALDAARRELFEETGTTESNISALFDYSVQSEGEIKHGRLFFAEIKKRGPLPVSEIEEIRIAAISPQPASFPAAHASFLEVLENHIRRE